MVQAAHVRQDHEPAPGELFADRYQIEELLGRGGMAAVYRARDLSLGEVIALKVLSFGVDPPPVAVLRFRQEVKLARRVTHPNVARVYDIGEHEGVIYLTMELIEGSTLRAVLARQRRLAPARVVKIAQVIAGALRAAHEAGVIHRDIKPTNIMVDRSGKVVLTDFGIARSLTEGSELTEGAIGTPHYMAPEQAQGASVDPRTDLYALGRCLYEMLTGRRASDTLERLADDLRGVGAPPALVEVTLRCLGHAPEARPASAAEVERALAEVAVDPTEATTEEAPVEVRSSVPAVPASAAAASVTPTAPGTSAAGATPAKGALAVLPFLAWGGPEAEQIAAALADELVDALSGLCTRPIIGARATARYRRQTDLRSMRDDLGAGAVIDGAVQLSANRLRIKVRLVDAATDAQLWSTAHEGVVGDLFALEATIASQLAEQLRVEFVTLRDHDGVPREAIQLYLDARAKLRGFEYAAATAAAQEFERCLRLAPDFTPAIAGHAIACARAWFFEPGHGTAPDWERIATTSVARASERAPELAESHLAAGMLALQSGEYGAAMRSLTRALAIAPTYAEAHHAVGEIECHAGHVDSGVKHLERARAIAPAFSSPAILLARQHALEGRFAACDQTLTELESQGLASTSHASIVRVRVAAWRGDRAVLRWFAEGNQLKHLRSWEFVRVYAEAALGELGAEEIERSFAALGGAVPNPRRMTVLAQLGAEVFAFRGERDATMLHLFRAASLTLIDLTWLDLCPLFAELRALPEFAVMRRRVELRVEAIWKP